MSVYSRTQTHGLVDDKKSNKQAAVADDDEYVLFDNVFLNLTVLLVGIQILVEDICWFFFEVTGF